jgi:hypothetical protein
MKGSFVNGLGPHPLAPSPNNGRGGRSAAVAGAASSRRSIRAVALFDSMDEREALYYD